MTTKQTNTITHRLIVWALIVTAILLIPYLGKFPWTISDFIFAGVVLYGCAAAYEIVTGNMKNKTHKIAVGFSAVIIVLLIWAWAVA